MTVTSFRVQNFMGFVDSGWIELRPITLLFGRNSCGKSALLRALLLLKQTIDARGDTLVFSRENGFDFGDYEENVYGHDLKRRISIGLQCTLPSDPEDTFQARYGLEKLGGDSTLVTLRLTYGYSVADHAAQLVSMDLHDGRGDVILQADAPGRLSDSPQPWQFRSQLLDTESNSDTNPFPFLRLIQRDALVPFLAWYDPAVQSQTQQLSGDYYALTSLLYVLSLSINRFFDGIDYISPLRAEPQRFYYIGGQVSGLTLRGRSVVRELVKGKRLDAINAWLAKSALRAQLEVRSLDDRKETLYEVRVAEGEVQIQTGRKDRKKSTTTSIGDVGFGISQVIPVAAQVLFADHGATVLIEQPELHLHPSAQADLADLFLVASSAHRAMLLVETHSEHLLLRLRRRIAETSAGVAPEDRQISPSDFLAYFVDRLGGVSFVEPLRLDKYGEFESIPPGFRNFFADDLKELLALTRAVQKLEEQAHDG